MRISTSTIYELGIGSVQQQQTDLLKIQQQVSTGRRILAPSDDPVASAQVLDVTQLKELNKQYDANGTAAKNRLETEESVLGAITSLIQDVKVLAVYAGDSALSNVDRSSLATELRSRFEELLGLANSTDGTGEYIFSGYKGTTLPFSEASPGTVTYNGDQGRRALTISSSRQIAIGDSGTDVFQRIKNGNGTFVAAASSTNTGTGVVSPGVVLDAAKWAASAQNYQVVFAVDNTGLTSVTTYDIVDSANNSLITGAASQTLASGTGGPRFPRIFTTDNTISFKQLPTDPGQPQYPANQPVGFAVAAPWDLGIEVSISGAPASSQAVGPYVPAPSIDTFSVTASTNQDLFATINNLITTLQTSVNSAADSAKLFNGLNAALSNLDLALDNILTVRASVGTRLKEIDSVKSTGEDLTLQYQQTISQLQDLDFAKSISDLSRQQANLEAAQKSYLKTQGLSLFNLI